jgi:hypothetical protein
MAYKGCGGKVPGYLDFGTRWKKVSELHGTTFKQGKYVLSHLLETGIYLQLSDQTKPFITYSVCQKSN